jgi:hypothetical protein
MYLNLILLRMTVSIITNLCIHNHFHLDHPHQADATFQVLIKASSIQ